MARFLNAVQFVPTLGGTTDFVVSSAVQGFMTPALAGATTGVFKYRAESADLTQWEIGEGTYTTGTLTITRTTVMYNSLGTGSYPGQSGAGTKINFASPPNVGFVQAEQDTLGIDSFNGWTSAQKLQARLNVSAVLKGQIYGVQLSAAGASASFSITAGEAADSTGVDLLLLASAYTKTTSAWAVGTGNGGLDTGGAVTINTNYAVYLIKRPDTGVVDVIFSLNATTPTLPANYTLYRRIGWIRTDGSSQWWKFQQTGDYFQYGAAKIDYSAFAVGTSRALLTMSGPPNTIARMRVYAFNAASPGVLYIQPTYETDKPVMTLPASLYWEISNQGAAGHFDIQLDSLSQFAAESSIANCPTYAEIYGWIDTRGKDA